MNFGEEELLYVKSWAKDDHDNLIINSSNGEFCILYLSSCNLWAFIIYNTIIDTNVIVSDLKNRNYQVVFSEECIKDWKLCNVEQFVAGKYVQFKYYAYI